MLCPQMGGGGERRPDHKGKIFFFEALETKRNATKLEGGGRTTSGGTLFCGASLMQASLLYELSRLLCTSSVPMLVKYINVASDFRLLGPKGVIAAGDVMICSFSSEIMRMKIMVPYKRW